MKLNLQTVEISSHKKRAMSSPKSILPGLNQSSSVMKRMFRTYWAPLLTISIWSYRATMEKDWNLRHADLVLFFESNKWTSSKFKKRRDGFSKASFSIEAFRAANVIYNPLHNDWLENVKKLSSIDKESKISHSHLSKQRKCDVIWRE